MQDARSRSACMGGEDHVMKQSKVGEGRGQQKNRARGDTTGGVKKDARDAPQKSAHLARVGYSTEREERGQYRSDTTGGV